MYAIMGAGLVCLIHYTFVAKPSLDNQRKKIAELRGMAMASPKPKRFD